MRLLIAFLVAAGSAHAEGLRGSISVGTGVAHDGWIGDAHYFREAWYGAKLEVGYRQWAGIVAYGGRPVNEGGSIALGARWSLRPDGSGFGAALQGSMGIERGPPSVDYRETLTVLSATAHWRWKLGFFLIDVGAGPALSFDSYRFPTMDYGADNGKLRQTVRWGVCANGFSTCVLPFDLELGVGFGF